MQTMHDDRDACQQEAPRSSQALDDSHSSIIESGATGCASRTRTAGDETTLAISTSVGRRRSVNWSWRPRSSNRSALRATLLLLCVCAWFLPGLTRAQEAPPEANLGEAAPLPPGEPVVKAQPADAEINPEPAPEVPEKDYLIPTDPLKLFLAGGISMWPLLFASLISLWFVLERMVVLRRRRVIPRAFVERFIQHLEQGKLNAETALRLCEENHSPIADVFAHGVRKWGKTSVEVEQAIIDGGERQIAQLRTHLRIIHGVYTVSPLLGLMGTVVGMIMSFNQLAQGGDTDRMQRLASGVGVALIATASGLFVAIPSFIFYMYLAGRVDGLVIEMDTLAQKVVNLISSEALASRARSNVGKSNPALAPVASGMPATKPKTVGT